MQVEKTNPIFSFCVLSDEYCVWIPVFTGMTKKEYPVFIRVDSWLRYLKKQSQFVLRAA
jgi:hypothetical protein